MVTAGAVDSTMDQRMNPRGITKNIAGKVEWSRPVSLSRAAKIMSRFAAVENGSSSAVSMYLDRTAQALNNLVRFHKKTSLIKKRNRDINGLGHNEKDHEDLENQGMENSSSNNNKKLKKKKKKMESPDDDEQELEGA